MPDLTYFKGNMLPELSINIYELKEKPYCSPEKLDEIAKALTKAFTFKEQEEILLEYVRDKIIETLNSFHGKPTNEIKNKGKYKIDYEVKKLLYPLNKQDFFIITLDINYLNPSLVDFDIHRDYAKYPRSTEEWAEIDKKDKT
jgi:hypothetical protein